MSEFKKDDRVRVIDRFSAFEGQLGTIWQANPSVVSVRLDSGNTLSRGTRTASLDLELIQTNPAAAQIQDDLNATIKSLGGDADPINSPAHYTAYPVGVIELTECLNFNRGNAVKYIARAGLKSADTEVQDLEKARWYIDREINRITT